MAAFVIINRPSRKRAKQHLEICLESLTPFCCHDVKVFFRGLSDRNHDPKKEVENNNRTAVISHCEARSNLELHDGLHGSEIASFLAMTMVGWIAGNARV